MTLLSLVPGSSVDGLAAQAALDELELVVRHTVEDDATWLRAQLNQLEHALLVLRLSGVQVTRGDGRLARVESTLQQTISAFRERLAALNEAAAALRPG